MNNCTPLPKRFPVRPPASVRGRRAIEVLESRVAPAGIVSFHGSGVVIVDLAAQTITDSSAPGSPVDFTGADVVQIGAGAGLAILGTTEADALSFTPTGASSGTLVFGEGNRLIQFTGITGAFTVDPLGGDDVVSILGDSGNNAILAVGGESPTVRVGATKAVTLVAGTTEALVVEGFGGDDSLTVDSEVAAFPVPIAYRGGDGFDTLSTRGGTATLNLYELGMTPDAGTRTLVIGGVTEKIVFTGLEPVVDTVSGVLTVNGTNRSNSITYRQASVATNGIIAVDESETIEFRNKSEVIINCLGGDDIVRLSNTATPTGLTRITVNGDLGDDVIATDGAFSVPVTFNGGFGNDVLDAASTSGGVLLNGNEGDDLLLGGSGNDFLDGGAGDDTFVGNGGMDNIGAGIGASLGDTILLRGTAGSDLFSLALDASGRVVAGVNGVTTTYANFVGGSIIGSGIELFAVEGLAGNDGLTINQSVGGIVIPINFDGGANADTLTLTGGTAVSDSFQPGPSVGEGISTMQIGAFTQVVAFAGVEGVTDLVAGPLVVTANDASNAITYTVGRNTANTADDTTRGKISVDEHVAITFSNKSSLSLQALGGDDTIGLHNPTTPLGLTSIVVNGGNPGASDRLVIPGTPGADTFTFVGSSPADGTVIRSGAVQIVYSNTRNVVLDGLAGADRFILASARGAVEIRGGDDADTVDFTGATAAVILDLDLLEVPQRVNATGEVIRLGDAIENFIGTSFNDTLYLRAASFPRTVDGGGQTVGQAGDTLVISGAAAVVNILPIDTNTGTIRTVGFANAGYDEFETRVIVNSPSGAAGFGTPATSEAFSTAHIYDPTLFTDGATPVPGKGPTAVATGDLNGDGFVDLVMVNSKTANLSILINQGDGTFSDPVNLPAGTPKPQDLVLGDFDGDMLLDVVVTFPKAGKLAFMKGDGAGSFGAPVATATPKFKPFAIAAANLDGDLDLDLAVTSRDTHSIATLLGDGAGGLTFGTPIKTIGKQPVDIAIADFNGDGSLDLATANAGSNNINLFRGDGIGGLAAPVRFGVGVRPSGLAAGDLDGDGDIDLAVSNANSRFVSVLLSAGNVDASGQFLRQLRVALPGQHQASAIAISDFDGDGVADLGVGNGLGTKFTVLRGLGAAVYSQPYDFDLGKDTKPNATTAIAIADLNNDGLLDVIATSIASNDLRTLLRK